MTYLMGQMTSSQFRVALQYRPANRQLLHLGDQRSTLQAKLVRCAVRASDYPLGTSGRGSSLAESELLRDRTCCALNYIRNFLGVRHIDAMTRTSHFDRVAMSSLGVPTFKVRVDGSIAS
jgi:hypothetical protein